MLELGDTVPGMMSGDEWVAASTARRRRRLQVDDNAASSSLVDTHKDTIRDAVPRLRESDVVKHAEWLAHSETTHDNVEANCAPNYSTSCIQEFSKGTHGVTNHDTFHNIN